MTVTDYPQLPVELVWVLMQCKQPLTLIPGIFGSPVRVRSSVLRVGIEWLTLSIPQLADQYWRLLLSADRSVEHDRVAAVFDQYSVYYLRSWGLSLELWQIFNKPNNHV